MRNALHGDVERTEALEIDADLAPMVAALGGGPGNPAEPQEGSTAAREPDAAGSGDASRPDAV